MGAVSTAKHFGIDESRAVTDHADHAGTQLNFQALSEAVRQVRCTQPLAADRKAPIDRDYNARK